jgi:choline kinase
MVGPSEIGFDGAIIAAGSGTRLRAAAGGIPKPLVELGGVTMLERQAAALLATGARKVTAIVNSETARIIDEQGWAPRAQFEIIVRDTANSMESMLTLGEIARPGLTLFSTVDAVASQADLNRFAAEAIAATTGATDRPFDGALAVVRWRGDRRPLFVNAADDGRIVALDEIQRDCVTAGFYMLPRDIFKLGTLARERGLNALRQFLGLTVERGWCLKAITLGTTIDVDEGDDLAEARALVAGVRGRGLL